MDLQSPAPPIPAAPEAAAPPEPVWGRLFLWVLLFLATLAFPRFPTMDLDASWRMALGWFFHQGLQVGRDVVFTYGPLGFLMGRTYSGLQFGSIMLWQVFSSAAFAVIIIAAARGLRGLSRFVYFAFFVLLGVTYEDALHMIIIALLAWALVRRVGGPPRKSTPWAALLLALLGIIKFTNLMLATLGVVVACVYALWKRRRSTAWAYAGWFFGGYLGMWILCGQNPLNLPLYLVNSLEVSRGYQEAMGLISPPDALWKGITVFAILVVYGLQYVWFHPDRARALANAVILGGLVFLDWKHGFVRSDGHMIGFFICALVPIVAFPALLEDGPRWRWLLRPALAVAGVLCIAGTYDALPGVIRYAGGSLQDKVWGNVDALLHWPSFRKSYDVKLHEQEQAADLPHVRRAVGNATVDVFGYEQAIALFNHLNYDPRPVFQSYMAYTPRLAQLNADFYESKRAPQFALLKIESLDNRYPALDDSRLLNIFVHDYEYVLSENGYQLWRRRADCPDPLTLAPRRIRTVSTRLNTPVALGGDLEKRHLWATVELPFSLLGRLRDAIYKPPMAQLIIDQQDGRHSEYRLPLLEGEAGFILNPAVMDVADYMNFAGGRPDRWVRSITVAVSRGARRYFAREARVTFFAMTPSDAGVGFFRQALRDRFWMFASYPVSFTAFTDPSETELGGQKAIVMHAPSEMVFLLPPGATGISGGFGFVPGAYQDGGNTDGAEFRVVWTHGAERTVLFSRWMNPHAVPADRGLQHFHVALTGLSGGELRLEVKPGPHNNAWDWTAWTGIEIK